MHSTTAFDSSRVTSHNVAGLMPGSDPKLKAEVVVLSAHLDHLGIGEPIEGDRIYNGAMDNASGIATLLDVAATLREFLVQSHQDADAETRDVPQVPAVDDHLPDASVDDGAEALQELIGVIRVETAVGPDNQHVAIDLVVVKLQAPNPTTQIRRAWLSAPPPARAVP